MIKVISNYDEFINSECNWDDLDDFCDFFVLKNWLLAWWKCYGYDKELRIYILTDEDGKAKVVFPLMLTNENNKLHLSQLSDSCSDHFKIICSPKNYKDIIVLLKFILQNERYNQFTINNLIMDDINTELLLNALLLSDTRISAFIQETNYFINTTGKYDEYFCSRSKNLKHKIRKIKKMADGFKFEVLSKLDDNVLGEMINLHCQKWENDMQVSVFYDQRRRDFLSTICQEFEAKEQLKIFVLKKDNKIIAYRLGFVFHNIYHDWNTSYDINYKEYSVGILLCDYIIKYCFENDIKKFDFLRGNEEYKKKFATGEGKLLKVSIENINIEIEDTNSPPKAKIQNILKNTKGFVFDLDGVVYSGRNPINNTIDFINILLRKKLKVGFLTNTSSKSCDEIKHKLTTMGIVDEEYYIETSALATAEYLSEKGFYNCTVCGGDTALSNEIKRKGINVVNINKYVQNVDAVVIGYSKKYEYSSLIKISELISNGSELIATDADKQFSHNSKRFPGTAWILSSIETVNNVKATVIGKPNCYSAKKLLEKMDLAPEDVIVIGDNIESDIMMAKNIGAYSCLLLGGVSSKEDIAKLPIKNRPEFVTKNLLDLDKENNYEKN